MLLPVLWLEVRMQEKKCSAHSISAVSRTLMIVARVGRVTKAVAVQAMEKTQVIREKLMGVVLNGVVRKGSYYYYYK